MVKIIDSTKNGTNNGYLAMKNGSLDWFKGKFTGNHGFYHQI